MTKTKKSTKKKTTNNPSESKTPAPIGAGVIKAAGTSPNIAVFTGDTYNESIGGMCGFILIRQLDSMPPMILRETVRMVFPQQLRRDAVTKLDCATAGLMRMLRALPRGWSGTIMTDNLEALHRLTMANQTAVRFSDAKWDDMHLAHRRLLIHLLKRLGRTHVRHITPQQNHRVIENVLAMGNEFWSKQVSASPEVYTPLLANANNKQAYMQDIGRVTYHNIEREDVRLWYSHSLVTA